MKTFRSPICLLITVVMSILLFTKCKKEEKNSNPTDFSLVSPFNLASDISLDEPMVWQDAVDPDGDDLVYDLYLGTTPVQSSALVSALTVTEYSPSLLTSTTYYWKVVALDQKGGSSESQTWSFSTLNNAPRPFSLINPSNGATGVSIVENLSWEASHDPDGDLVTYDIYFGTIPEASTLVKSGHTYNTYTPVLEKNTTYYWKIISKDPRGATSESEIWSFSTEDVAK